MSCSDMYAYEFGPFHLDVSERLLLRNKQAVPLTAKTFNLLTLLVRERGRLVEKDVLMREIWPNNIVEDSNLTVSMSMLRKALGESRGGREYVETIPKCGYRFVAEVTEISKDVGAAGTNGEARNGGGRDGRQKIDSIAVLPLLNTTDDSGLESVSDSITESLINNLSRLTSLKVIAMSRVFRYKGIPADPVKAGRELGVRSVLVGRIEHPGNLTIRLELVDASDGSLIWSERFSRRMPDVLTAQEEIAGDISELLQLKLSGEERKRIAHLYRANTEARCLYLKGRYFLNKCTYEGVQKAVKNFRQAIEADPTYALAYAGLADSYQRISSLYSSPKETLPKAKAAAVRAVEIDGGLSEAHVSLGLLKVHYDNDWPGAEVEFKRALDLNPETSLAHKRFGECLMLTGRFNEALAEYKKALNLNPLSLQANVMLGTNLSLMGQHKRAIGQLEKALELDANYYPARLALGCAHLQARSLNKALSELHLACQLEKNSGWPLGFLGHAYAVAGRTCQAERILRRLQHPAQGQYVSPYSIAIVYLGLGESGAAIEWLEKIFEEQSGWLVQFRVGPELDSLRSDARFKALQRRAGFKS